MHSHHTANAVVLEKTQVKNKKKKKKISQYISNQSIYSTQFIYEILWLNDYIIMIIITHSQLLYPIHIIRYDYSN